MTRRAATRAVVSVVALVALALLAAGPAAWAATDVLANVGPASQVGGGALMNAYPLGNYALDHHFAAVEAGVFSGVDVSGIAPTIAWFVANVLWTLTAFLAHATVTLFTFAFSLDLVNGSGATGGAGALAPVSEAVRSIYRSVFGGPWLVVAITVTGLWAIWHALVRRRYTETAGALALSVVFVVIALAFVTQPERTIGQASRWTNDMSGAFLALASRGDPGDRASAKQEAADKLFALLVYEPWVVLQFGGREHCTRNSGDDDPDSVPVRPLSDSPARDAALSRALARSRQIAAEGKTCVNNANKYAHRFLSYPPGSDERDQHHEALQAGDTGKAPEADRAGYRLGAADTPAADAMGPGGQYQRLLLAIVILAGELGAFGLIGALSVAVILAQVLVLVLLAFAPVALVIGVFPGRGHDFFRAWLTRLAGFLVRKAAYSLILAILLTVVAAVGQATSNLGWLMAFGLQATFFWTVLLWRKQLLGQITKATTGHTPDQDGRTGIGRLASLYGATNLAGRIWHARPGARTPAPHHATDDTPAGGPPPPSVPPEPPAPGEPSGGGGPDAGTQGPPPPSASPSGTPPDRQPVPPAPGAAAGEPAGPGRDTAVPRVSGPALWGGQRSRTDSGPGAPTDPDGPTVRPGESPLARGLRDDERRLHSTSRLPATDERPAPPTVSPAHSDTDGRTGDVAATIRPERGDRR